MAKQNRVKERVLNTASRLFYQQGFNNTGINQIIAEADIAIGSLYKHYRSKNDLLYHYLQSEEDIFFTNLEAYLRSENDPLKKLIQLINYRIRIQEKANCLGCHFIKINAELGRSDERVNQIVEKHMQLQRDFVERLITDIGKVQPLPGKEKELGDIIFLMIEGAIVSAGIHGNTKHLKFVKKTVLKMF